MKKILDACCGSRMFWFDKQNPNVIFADNRQIETKLCDGRALVIKPDEMSSKYDFDFNEEMIKDIEIHTDSNNPFYKRCELSGVYDLLVSNGFEDAAVFLAEKVIETKEKKKGAKESLTLPKYQEIRKRFNQSTLDAFYAFCFMGCEFLEEECKCTRGALLEKFLNFANKMLYKMDEDYFMDKVAYYKKKHDLDVLQIMECDVDE